MTIGEAYVRDLFQLVRELAADARASGASSQFAEGRESAFVEVLMLMQTQADTFGIARAVVGMAEFDPLNDPLR